MGRKKINTGDILKIPLWGDLGFAYAKYIDLVEMLNQDMATFIRVYDYWTKTNNFEIEKLKKCKYLIQPIKVAGIYPALRKKLWEIVGHIEPTTEDIDIPHFRTHNPRWEEERNAREWCYIEGCDLEKRTITRLENIKHLERWGAEGTGNIEIRVTIQIIKKLGLNFEDYLDMEDETVQYQYKLAMESPLLSEIPHSMHGKAKTPNSV